MLGLSLAACLTFLFIPKTKLTYTIVAVTAIVIAVVAGPPVIKEFGSIFADEGERDNSAQSRLTLWRAAFTIANDYPLTGVGPGATQFFIPRYEPIYSNTTAKHPHNVFLDVLSGSGYPALLLLVVLLCIPWLRALKIIRLRDPTNLHRNYLVTIPILIGIPAFSVSGFFAGSGMIESIYYMLGIAVGGMLSYERIYQDEIHAQNTDAESDIDDEETTISERYSGLEQAESV
jgi:O-antigen ligase